MQEPNRIIQYLPPAVKAGRKPHSRAPLRLGPAPGLIIAILALVGSLSLHATRDDLPKEALALLLLALACAASAAGCVSGFGDHDNGCLPVRAQIFGVVVGTLDLIMTFTTLILLAALLKP